MPETSPTQPNEPDPSESNVVASKHAAADAGYDTISFLSDYGTADVYVGIVHSVLRQMAPDAAVIDLTHEIAPFDVRAGALALARTVQFVAPGVILAVVDPGVGTERRAVAIQVAGGKAVLLGPDNGLLAGAVAMVGGAERAFELDRPDYHLASESTTFDGRDVFAPVAAHLCNGVTLEELGTEIDVHGLMPGVMPLSRIEDGALICESLAVDRFGNVQLNVDPEEIAHFGSHVAIEVAGTVRTGERVDSFAAVGAGRIGLLVDSDGLISLVAQSTSASEELALPPAAEVTLRALDEADSGPVPVSVKLGAANPLDGSVQPTEGS